MKRRDEIGFIIGFVFLMQEFKHVLTQMQQEISLSLSDGERESLSDPEEFAIAIAASLFQKARQLPSSTKSAMLEELAELARVTPE